MSSLCSILNFSHTAPSAAPTSVRESGVTSSSITVQWGAVDCIHHNGDITGYSVWYGVQGSGSTQTRDVSGGSITEATISSLIPSTTYSIQVSAVNSAGIGVYSDPPVIVETLPSKYTSVLCTCEKWGGGLPPQVLSDQFRPAPISHLVLKRMHCNI